MSNRNSISTPEIKAAQNKYASQRETLQELERTKKQLAHKLTALVAEATLDKEAKTSAHDKALKAYSAAIAAGDTAAEAEADTALQSILSESDRSRGKHLARTAAIAKLEQEIAEIDQRLEQCTRALEASHKELLKAIMYKRAELFRSNAAELVTAAKRYQEIVQVLGIPSCLASIEIPLPATHMQGRIDYISPYTISPGATNPTIEELLAA
jgi:tetratricopeptide (TPR) repeat protein